jgi:predicted enzyme related to lactoylglutathione lyase
MSDGVTGLGGVFFRASDPDPEVDEETQDQEGIGRFGWAVDPEGNRFELWEPAEGM